MQHISRLIAVGALLATTMIAQRPFGVMTSSTPPDPATVVANAAQATTIFTNALTAITPLQTTLSTHRTGLQAAFKTNSTATIDQLATSIGSLTGQIVAIQNKADAAFYAILTAAQQTTLDASGGFGGGFGPGGPRH